METEEEKVEAEVKKTQTNKQNKTKQKKQKNKTKKKKKRKKKKKKKKDATLSVLLWTLMNIQGTTHPFLQPLSTVDSDNTTTPAQPGDKSLWTIHACHPGTLYSGVVAVCWLLNVPATFECISGTDLLRQFYVLPH